MTRLTPMKRAAGILGISLLAAGSTACDVLGPKEEQEITYQVYCSGGCEIRSYQLANGEFLQDVPVQAGVVWEETAMFEEGSGAYISVFDSGCDTPVAIIRENGESVGRDNSDGCRMVVEHTVGE